MCGLTRMQGNCFREEQCCGDKRMILSCLYREKEGRVFANGKFHSDPLYFNEITLHAPLLSKITQHSLTLETYVNFNPVGFIGASIQLVLEMPLLAQGKQRED